MRTDDLIDALARDAKVVSKGVRPTLATSWGLGLAGAMVLFMLLLGPREDFAHAILSPWYPLKLAVLGLLAIAAIPVIEASARPGAAVPGALLALPLALLGAAIAYDIATLGLPNAGIRLWGSNGFYCLTLIPVLATPLLIASVAGLRSGAPTQPVRTGLIAGLFSGAVGGVLYGLYCPDDSPLFVAFWYSLAIGALACAGALAGRFFLRW